MDKFIVIKVMNEAMLRFKKSKNEEYDKNEKIKEFLNDEALFFKIKEEAAKKLLINVGVREEKLEEVYQDLTSKNVYDKLIEKGKINLEKDHLVVKYN